MADSQNNGNQQFDEMRSIAGKGAEAGFRAARAAAGAPAGGAAAGTGAGAGGGTTIAAAGKALIATLGAVLAPVIGLLLIVFAVVVILLLILMAIVGGSAASRAGGTGGAGLGFSTESFLQAVDNVYQTAHANDWLYGNSTTAVPCEDGYVSCDRLIARALYDMGCKDQPAGGITCGNIEEWCTAHGFSKITDKSQLTRGDIVYVETPADAPRDRHPHVFVLTAYDPDTDICSKYDTGSQERIRSIQPFENKRLVEESWANMGRVFRFALRPPAGGMQVSTGGQTAAALTYSEGQAYTTLDSNPVTASGIGGYILYNASKHMGAPYVLGGDSYETGLDCSHYVAKVLAESGCWDGHWVHSNEWAQVGEPVASLAEAQAGDVLVYRGDPNGHVVIYDGQGRIFESTDPQGVIHERPAEFGMTLTAIRRVRGTGSTAPPAASQTDTTVNVSHFAQKYTTVDANPVTVTGPGGYAVYLASKYVGYPYLWGGDSLTGGIDCSHYVAAILHLAGLWDGHWVHSTEWRYEGIEVPSLAQAQAGDVIVYSGHVALYDGAGYIYEAKGSKWGITHDRRADCKPILGIRRMPGAGNSMVVQTGPVTMSQAVFTSEVVNMVVEELDIPFGGAGATFVSYVSSVARKVLSFFGLDKQLGADGIRAIERAWAGTSSNAYYGPGIQASYFWDPANGDGQRGLGVLANEGYDEYQVKFFQVLAPITKPYADKYGLCTSYVMTKLVSECGWIHGDKLSKVNNCFGMNAFGPLMDYTGVDPPAWASYRTQEKFLMTHPGGSTWDAAKTYQTLNDGIEDYCAVMAARYPAVRNTTDPHEEMLITSGYTEGKSWIDACTRLINKYDLRQYD